MTKNTTKFLLAGLASFSIAGTAAADKASSYAYLAITDLIFEQAGGAAITPGADLNVLAQSSTSSTSASLRTNFTVDNTVTVGTGTIVGPDAAMSIVTNGNGALPVFVENDATNFDVPLKGSFSRADTWTPTGDLNILDNSAGGGADAIAVAETDVWAFSSGRSEAKLNLNATFNFVALSDLDTQISFDADWVREVSLLPQLVSPSRADADTEFQISIDNLTDGLSHYSISFTPATGGTFVLPNSSSLSRTQAGSASFFDLIPTFEAGKEYNLSINHVAQTEAYAIPSPSAAVFGIAGLMGLGIRRRRSAK